jgi:hypothetical protein
MAPQLNPSRTVHAHGVAGAWARACEGEGLWVCGCGPVQYIDVCKRILATNSKWTPKQSNLLVVSCISYIDAEGVPRLARGVNSEPCVIAGSLCGERSALTRIMLKGFTRLDTVCVPPCNLPR